jgi:hypothetical protein
MNVSKINSSEDFPMKKFIIAAVILATAAAATLITVRTLSVESKSSITAMQPDQVKTARVAYAFPEFYRGIYLTKPSGKDPVKLQQFIAMSKKSNINVMVVDVQPAPGNRCGIPAENVKMILEAGIHPVARVVCFQDGLRYYPVPKEKLEAIWETAVSSAEAGFKEIQFDYIRFEDSAALKHMGYEQRYAFVEGLISTARERLARYNVKISADVFGRIPLNKNDIIGQRMESLDKVTDIICPMAYPSHYTWSQKMMKDPYYTVHLTSTKAKERVKNAQIVPWIQAFNMKVKMSGLSFEEYQVQQIKAVYDAGVSGYIFWNARQDYATTFRVMEQYYTKTKQTNAE